MERGAPSDHRITTAPPAGAFVIGVLLFLGLRLLLQARLYEAGFQSLTADEFARVCQAARWAEHPRWVTAGEWLPLHLYLYGAWLRLWWDLVWAPRVLTLVFGLCGIVALAVLTRSALRSWRWGLVAAGLFALSPAHVWLSATPLTEAPYTAFVLTAVASLAAHLRTGRASLLWLGAVCLGLASGLRYEGWMLAIPYTAVLLACAVRRASWRRDLVVAIVPWLVPLGWLAGQWLGTGDPLRFLHAIQAYKHTWYGDARSYTTYVRTFFRLDPFVTVLLPVGALLAWRSRDVVLRTLAILVVIPLVIFIVLHGGQVEPTNNSVRYLAPFLVLAYPLALVAVRALGERVARASRGGITVLAVVLGLLVVLRQVSQTFAFHPDGNAAGLAVGERLRELRADVLHDPSRPVVIELTYWAYLAVQVGANDVDRVLYDRAVDLERRQSRSVFFTDWPTVRACLAEHHVAYVAVRSPELRALLRQRFGPTDTERVGDWEILAVPPAPADTDGVGHADCPREWDRVF